MGKVITIAKSECLYLNTKALNITLGICRNASYCILGANSGVHRDIFPKKLPGLGRTMRRPALITS